MFFAVIIWRMLQLTPQLVIAGLTRNPPATSATWGLRIYGGLNGGLYRHWFNLKKFKVGMLFFTNNSATISTSVMIYISSTLIPLQFVAETINYDVG